MKKRLLSIIFALVLGMSFFAGCAGSASNSDSIAQTTPTATTQSTTPTSDDVDEGYYPREDKKTDGIHVLTAPETERYIVKDGKCDYAIVIPENADSRVNLAKDEFKALFLQATGYALPVIVETADNKLTHTPEGKYFSIGETAMLQSAKEQADGVLVDYDVLGPEGVRIVTVDNTVYMVGGNGYGTISAIYDYLQICFNFDCYYYDTWDLDTGVINHKLRDFDVVDIPDIKWRGNTFGYCRQNVANNVKYKFRQYLDGYGDLFFPTYERPGCQGARTSIHNTDELINEYTPGYNKDWVSDNGNQLCYTSHGNPETYEGLVYACAQKMIESYMKTCDDAGGKDKISDWKRYFAITIEDNAQTCTCPACYAEEVKYGSRSGSVIKLCNAVISYINDYWMNTEEGLPYKRDDIKISFFAYHEMIYAPVFYNEETGKYEATAPEVEMRPDCNVYYCMSGTWARSVDFFDPANDQMRVNYLAWKDMAADIIIWGYQANFTTYAEIYPTWEHFDADAYSFFFSGPVSSAFNQAQGANTDVTHLHGLKAYCEAKYQWDVTYDYDELVAKYFKGMFREAADIMREYMDYATMYYTNLATQYGWEYNTGLNITRQQYHPLQELRDRMAYLDKALDLITEIYAESNPEIYEQVKWHIDLEWLGPAYLMHSLYSTDYIPEAEYNELTNRLREIGKRIGRVDSGEGATEGISNYIRNL